MIAHKALGISVAVVLIGFFAGANAGKCIEVQSVDAGTMYKDGVLANVFLSDLDGAFGQIDDWDGGQDATVDHYRGGVLINSSLTVDLYNNTGYSPTTGDGYVKRDQNFVGFFEKGDFLCFFPGVMMTPIAETGTGYSDCTGIVSNIYSGSSGIDSLEECKAKCLGESTCNTINYCSDSSGCTTSTGTRYDYKYCWVKKCTGDDYKITTTYGNYDIYTKMNESCTDLVQNQMEEGVDCGGPNCESSPCPTCTDKIKNQDEEDIDCGGSCPDACPTCTDKIKNGDEDDVDCGGACDACPSCTDGIRNQDEEDVDCGGACDVCPCKNKLTRQQCNGKFKNGKCNRPWVQKRCKATCGHYTKCCGNKMGDQRCERLKPYCNANWIVPEWIAKKVGNRCKKTCGKCPN